MRISWLTRCLLTVPVVFARHIPRQASDETIINTAAPSTIVSTQPSATLTAGLSSTAGPVETPTNLPIKFYTLTLTKEYISPNGDWREAILINGQTPGPLLELEEGQEVSITVKNYCGEPATVHWHGIYQYETVWADGVAGVTQYPIDHGDQFVYNFTARQHGQYWWVYRRIQLIIVPLPLPLPARRRVEGSLVDPSRQESCQSFLGD